MERLYNKPNRMSIEMTIDSNPEYTHHMWVLNLENFRLHYLEWDKRLKAMIKKDLKKKKQENFNRIPYNQFVNDLYNKMYGSLIATIYTDIEFDLSTIVGSTSNISRLEKLQKKYKDDYKIDITKISNYEKIKELKEITDDFKHNAGVSRGESISYCTSFGNTKEIDYKKMDISTTLNDCQIFFDDLKEQINIRLNTTKEK